MRASTLGTCIYTGVGTLVHMQYCNCIGVYTPDMGTNFSVIFIFFINANNTTYTTIYKHKYRKMRIKPYVQATRSNILLNTNTPLVALHLTN